MAVLSLFETSRRDLRAGARGRAIDFGRLPRERRLAFYLTACQTLGRAATELPLRFVRCTDGRLRIYDPLQPGGTLAAAETGSGMAARLERELRAGAAAIATGGGIAYDIDLETGDLRVREVVRAARALTPAAETVLPYRRRGGARDFAAGRSALQAAPGRA